MAPQTAFFQAAYRSRYGHPAPEVMARYRALGASYDEAAALEIVDSPHCGAFVWRSDLPHAGICTRAQGLRYWHHRPP